MRTHDYHSNNDDGLNWATLRTFSKSRVLLDNEHVRQDGPLGLGQYGPGPSCPNPLYDALWLSVTKYFLVLFKYLYDNKAYWKVIRFIRCTEYNSMLSKQHGCIIIFLVDQSWWSSYMFEYYEVHFTFTPAPPQLHYGRYVIQHCRPQNRRQLWVLEIYGAKHGEGPSCPR